MQKTTTTETARDIMKTHVLSFAPDADIHAAVESLLRHGYAGAPVVDKSGAVVGMLSELDLLRVLSNAAFHGVPTGTVESFMTRDVETVPPTADLYALSSLFCTGEHRRVPVVEGGKLLGLVTRRDLLRALERASHHPDRKPTTYDLIAARR